MGILGSVVGKFVSNTFDSDLSKAIKLPQAEKFYLANGLVDLHTNSRDAIALADPQFLSKYLTVEANAAKQRRHEAKVAGATGTDDLSWFLAAIAESYCNVLRTSKSADRDQSVRKLGEFIDQSFDRYLEDVENAVSAQPVCTANLVIASPKYNVNYKCVVTLRTQTVHALVCKVCSGRSGLALNYQSKVAQDSFNDWLNAADPKDFTATHIPHHFYSEFSSHLHELAEDVDAIVYCPECANVVENMSFDKQSQSSNTLRSTLIDQWFCSNGHSLYAEEREILWNRKPSPTATQSKPPAQMSLIAEHASIVVIMKEGQYAGISIELANEDESLYLSQNLKNQSALSAFVSAVERRIKSGDLENPSIDHQASGLQHQGPTLNQVPRIACSSNMQVLFNWSKGT